MKTVSLLEDCPHLTKMMREVINASGRYRCISTFSTIAAARLRLVENSPDIVIFDIHLPDGSGVDCVRWLKPRLLDTEFIAFTGQGDADSIFDAIRAGAVGYLSKGTHADKLVRALDDLVAGGSPLSAGVARMLLDGFSGESKASTPLPSLTRREKEILAELVRGRMLKEITETLSISLGTLNTHTRNLYRKLGVHSRNEIMTRYFAGSAGEPAAP